MKAKVSIIIPCYNALPFIKETLDSLLRQTYKNIEVIIIDDGSTDGTIDFLKTVTIPSLTIKGNPGKGACAARNYGLELATGDYIQFLDADDLISPYKIEKQVTLLQGFPNCITVCSTVHFYTHPEDGTITDSSFMFSTNQPQDFLLNLYGADGKTCEMVQTSAWLTPRSIVKKAGPWDETLLKDQDGEFFCRVVMASEGVRYTSEVFNYYRKDRSLKSVSGGKSEQHLQSQLRALASKEQVLHSFRATKAYTNAMALQYKFIAIDAYPEFKHITTQALQKVKAHGGSTYVPILGGRSIECMKYMFGWKITKAFSYHIHKNKLISALRK